jgi:HAD superfamily hydrolase (TIGR01458 family)
MMSMREGTTSASQGDARVVRGVLLDLDGVVYVGGSALPGSLEAISRIRAAKLPLKFITNTTRRPRRRIVRDLAQLGLQVALEDVYTPAALAHDFLARRNLAPFLVVHPELREDFSGLRTDGEEAVVVGDAGEFFTYDLLNQAYRKILQGAVFLALAKNRNFLDHDGELSLDAVPFVAGLEFASGREATVLGKPAPTFFKLAVEGLRCAVEDVAMIGDDAEADVGGAMAAGLMGVLVQTGKYRPDQEAHLAERPTLVAKNLEVAVDLLLG